MLDRRAAPDRAEGLPDLRMEEELVGVGVPTPGPRRLKDFYLSFNFMKHCYYRLYFHTPPSSTFSVFVLSNVLTPIVQR